MMGKTIRPPNWDDMTPTQKTRWTQTHARTKTAKRKKYTHLKGKDAPKIHMLMTQHKNKSFVAELLGVSRRSLIRFLEKNPIPESFTIQDEVTDYEEIKVWQARQKGFSKEGTAKGYMRTMGRFYQWMLTNHPERARPSLWSSDEILEFVQTFPPNLQHGIQTALRQLGKKTPKLFPLIDLGLLPTRKASKARRSLAGHEEYYLSVEQVRALIQAVAEIDNFAFETKVKGKMVTQHITYTDLQKKCYQAVIAVFFNMGVRTGDHKKGLGLCAMRIENLKIASHTVTIKDKFDITWRCLGLSDDTCRILQAYLDARGNPTSGWLFVNGHGNPLDKHKLNKMLKVAGAKAGITDKKLVCKTFRKSMVKYCLDLKKNGGLEMNPVSLIGTGKDPKTCFCVGWTSMKVLFQHYAPQLKDQIEQDRQKFRL